MDDAERQELLWTHSQHCEKEGLHHQYPTLWETKQEKELGDRKGRIEETGGGGVLRGVSSPSRI